MRLRSILAALALAAGLVAAAPAVTPAHATYYSIFANDCYAAHTTSGPRACVDTTVPTSPTGASLYVFANGGDTWTARAEVSLGGFVCAAWESTASTNYTISNGWVSQGCAYDPTFTPYVGPVTVCASALGSCTGGATIYVQGSYASYATQQAKSAINAGAPFFVVS